MSGKCFVDTDVMVYAHDRSTGAKHQRVRDLLAELWDSGQGVLSTQVLQELCINLRRKAGRPLPLEETRKVIEDYLSWEVVVNTVDSIIHALEIEARYKTSFWDALIIHAAESAGADTLYSEDLAGRQKYGSVRVINPFDNSKDKN